MSEITAENRDEVCMPQDHIQVNDSSGAQASLSSSLDLDLGLQ